MSNDVSTNLVIPCILDYSANVIVYGETQPDVSFSYSFAVVDGFSINRMKSTFKYKDDNSGVLLKYDVSDNNYIQVNDWHDLIVDNHLTLNYSIYSTNSIYHYRMADTAPDTNILGEQIIMWVCSNLFGHPLAQAPITNDATIVEDVSDSTLGSQLYTTLTQNGATHENGTKTNPVLQSIYEQLINAGRFLELEPDTNQFLSFPFVVGDVLTFYIRITANASNEDVFFSGSQFTNVSQTNLQTIFSNILDTDPSTFPPEQKPLIPEGSSGVRIKEEIFKFSFAITA